MNHLHKHGDERQTAGRRRHGVRHRKQLAVAFAVLGMGALGAGCGVGSAATAPGHASVLTAAKRSTQNTKVRPKQTTLAQCGATRDPFDPTDSSAPAGSATTC